MSFWMGIAAAQNAAAGTKPAGTKPAGTKPAGRGHRVLSIVGGIALALLIAGGLLIVMALSR